MIDTDGTTIIIDTDKACRECGEPGATPCGLCLRCAARRLKAGTLKQRRTQMKFRSIRSNDRGEVTVKWETTNGSIVTVAKAFPVPPQRLSEAMQAVIPQVAALRNEPASESRMFLRGLTVREKTIRVRGREVEATLVRLDVAESVDRSEKAAAVKLPDLLLDECDGMGQAVMWPDMRSAVSAVMHEAEAYFGDVKAAL